MMTVIVGQRGQHRSIQTNQTNTPRATTTNRRVLHVWHMDAGVTRMHRQLTTLPSKQNPPHYFIKDMLCMHCSPQ